MVKYGKLLLAELPDDTTRLLQDLCTEWVPKGQQPSAGVQSAWNMDCMSWNVDCVMEYRLWYVTSSCLLYPQRK